LLVYNGKARTADESAVFAAGGRILKSALRSGNNTRRYIRRAVHLEEASASRGAHCARNILDGNVDFVRFAGTLERIGVVGSGSRWSRSWYRSRGRCHRAKARSASGVARLLGNAAHVLAFSHEHVAVKAPASAPAILHLPVVFAVKGAVANNKNAMVEVGAAGRAVEYTALVKLESRLVSFDGNGHRLGGDSSLETSFVLGRNIGVASKGDLRRAGALAGAGGASA